MNYEKDKPKYDSFLNNLADPEPDLFHFNFASFSGTMFYDKESKKWIVRKEKEYLDVTFIPHYFKHTEKSKIFTYPTLDYYNASISRNSNFAERFPQPEIVTAWYLSSIVSPTGKIIEFSYGYDEIYSPVSVSEDVSYQLDLYVSRISLN